MDETSDATVWVDMAAPSPDEARILTDVFHFHPLSVEDALSAVHHPKVEAYGRYLYVILHGIDATETERQFATRDVDFFVGPNYLVTVHDGRSRSLEKVRELCRRHPHVLAEGPFAVLHRIVDTMVDHYRPEIERLEDALSTLEEEAYAGRQSMARRVLEAKRDLAVMRRVLIPQRDAIGRLSRREFAMISDEMAYRFRDLYDQMVRLSEETFLFQDRVTSILEVNLATMSNRLNQVMKLLTVISTIFLPLTVLTGMWGMNIVLPALPGGETAQFWWIAGIMLGVVMVMLFTFRRSQWI